MEQMTFDLHPEPATNTRRIIQRTLFGLMGMSSLVQGAIIHNDFRYINFVFGLPMIVFALFYRQIYKPKVFTFSEDNIIGPIGKSKRTKIDWSEISKIDISLFSISLFLRTDEKINMYIGNLTFQELRRIKSLVMELAKAKGVEVQAA
jgi:hypothetical protein